MSAVQITFWDLAEEPSGQLSPAKCSRFWLLMAVRNAFKPLNPSKRHFLMPKSVFLSNRTLFKGIFVQVQVLLHLSKWLQTFEMTVWYCIHINK